MASIPAPRMVRQWHYLDPLNQARGPVTDGQLDQVLQRGDCRVWTPGMSAWEWASEYFAHSGAPPVGAARADDRPEGPGRTGGRRMHRGMDGIFELIRGVVRDGVVTRSEVLALGRWLQANEDLIGVWPANVLIDRLQRIFADGSVTDEELRVFGELLSRIGEPPVPGGVSAPAQRPAAGADPAIHFGDRIFVFAGAFLYGTRAQCEEQVVLRGGRAARSITPRVHYVVTGAVPGRGRQRSALEAKVARAVELRSAGVPISILSEEQWVRAIRSRPLPD